ncbi:hypothetical protein ACN47E_003646 [Coniothyrium glycines]
MFRRPGAGRSKASVDTLCQKCLKRGHYSYECTAPAQERPYKSRPSRTQQLLNPKLQPKLTTEVPNELLRKKGVADEILKKKENERRRSRSLSTSSADSVSTISTNRSPSRSRSPPPGKKDGRKPLDDKALGKRRRRSASMESTSLDGSYNGERNTRRRMSSFSPGERGRRRTRSRSISVRMQVSHADLRGKAFENSDVPRRGKARSRSRDTGKHDRRPNHGHPPSRSRSRSADRMDISEERNPRRGMSPPHKAALSRSPSPFQTGRGRSPSPYTKRRAPRRSPDPRDSRNGFSNRPEPRGPGRNRFDDGPARSNGRQAPPPAQPPPVQRERSLSPFSKRVALTRAMQSG